MAFEKCPQCGYMEVKQQTGFSQHMNSYVDEKTGKVDGVFNSNLEKLTFKDGRVVVREDIWKKAHPPVTKTPITPLPPTSK